MNARRLAGVLAVLLMLQGVRADEGPTEKVKKHLGDELVKLLQGATRVEAFRIAPAAAKPGEAKIADYPIKATAKEPKEGFAKRLAAALLDEKALFGTQKRCFLPGVAFRLWKDKESVEVIVCFGCQNLRLIARDADGKEVKRVSGAFGPGDALLKLAREAFPDDKELQEIKEKK
jgi:hypothetical protein